MIEYALPHFNPLTNHVLVHTADPFARMTQDASARQLQDNVTTEPFSHSIAAQAHVPMTCPRLNPQTKAPRILQAYQCRGCGGAHQLLDAELLCKINGLGWLHKLPSSAKFQQ